MNPLFAYVSKLVSRRKKIGTIRRAGQYRLGKKVKGGFRLTEQSFYFPSRKAAKRFAKAKFGRRFKVIQLEK